jgi:hypothetical protein
VRAGKSFSENEWRAWLKEIAQRHRDGVREFSMKMLGETASRADLSENDVFARLSDIIDGQFTTPTPSGGVQLKPAVVAHALGAALLYELDGVPSPTFDTVSAHLSQRLDPITGLDQRAEILRAAVSIVVERGGAAATPVAGVLVTAWLQTQNVTDVHRRELEALAPALTQALLDAIEHSGAHSQASARLWAVNALRAIKRDDMTALAAIVSRARQWFSIVSRDLLPPGHANADAERNRVRRFIERLGIDAPGELIVLGLPVRLVDRDDGVLAATIPSILEGFPLATATPTFEAAAIALAISRNDGGWRGLKWLCLLNDVDPTEAASALRRASTCMHRRVPETGISGKLPARAASLLLWLTGEEHDEDAATALDPGLDRAFSYQTDYLSQPSRSIFALERRHARDALTDTGLPLVTRIQRTRDMWHDPTFEPPATFVAEVVAASAGVDVTTLSRHSSLTIEEHSFSEMEIVLARCAPEVLADISKRRVQSFATCPPESRYWSAIRATDHAVLAGKAEADAARALRLSGREKEDSNELYAASQLLIMEIINLNALEQTNNIINADMENILLDIDDILNGPTLEEADNLIAEFGSGVTRQKRDLLVVLSHASAGFSESAWSWISSTAFGPEAELHGLAYRALAQADLARFGRELARRGWAWSAADSDHWVSHYGTGALIAGTTALPFDQVAPNLAPWRVLEAARSRGADPSEIRLAALIFSRVLAAERIEPPDPGSMLSVDRTDEDTGPLLISITPPPADEEAGDPIATLRAEMDGDARLKAQRRAADIAAKRISEARRAGASLYLTDLDAADFGRFSARCLSSLMAGWKDWPNSPRTSSAASAWPRPPTWR